MWCVCVYIYIYIFTYLYILEYYSAIKKNKTLPFAATWMDLEDTVISEISQTER